MFFQFWFYKEYNVSGFQLQLVQFSKLVTNNNLKMMQYLEGVNTVWFSQNKNQKSQWLQLRRNNFGKKKKKEKKESPCKVSETQVTLRIRVRTQLSSSTKPHFCTSRYKRHSWYVSVSQVPQSSGTTLGRVAKTSRVPFFFHHSRSLILCTARLSRTAAAGPWRPSWARWLGAAASQSQRPRPAWRVSCAWGRPGRWSQSGRCLPGSAPAPGRLSVSPSLWRKIIILHFIIGRGGKLIIIALLLYLSRTFRHLYFCFFFWGNFYPIN